MRALLAIFTVGMGLTLVGAAVSDGAVELTGFVFMLAVLAVAVWSWLHGVGRAER